MSNMYSFISHKWNPLGGRCPHKCTYCSTDYFARRFDAPRKKYSGAIRLIESEMSRNLGKGKTWFVASQNDLFADSIPAEWIIRVLNHCQKFDNTYYFQTKNPKRFLSFVVRHRECFPEKTVFCCTIESDYFHFGTMGDTPYPKVRACFARQIADYFPVHITVEPVLHFTDNFPLLLKTTKATQINIGADSKRHNLKEPSKEDLQQLIFQLSQWTTVHIKPNLERILH